MSIVVEDKEDELWTNREKHLPNQPPKYLGFVAGCASGVMKNLVGHPLDTIKNRMQTAPNGQFSSSMDCVIKTFKNEGVFGFFKGMTPPLVGWVFMDSVMLGSLHIYRRYAKDYLYPQETKLPITGHMIAGLASGLTVSFVAGPIELIKANLQVQYDSKNRLYKGPIDVIRKFYNIAGIRGLYRGLFATMIFRTNFVFWWGSYEMLTRYFETNTNLSKPAINFWSGGLSATVFWVFAYPADVVKQTIMTDSIHPSQRRFPRWRDAARYIYREKGMAGFTRGFGPAILRSFPANAAALAAFEAVMRFLH